MKRASVSGDQETPASSSPYSIFRGAYRFVRKCYRQARFSLIYAGKPIKIDPTSWIAHRSVLKAFDGGTITIGKHCEIHSFAMILANGGPITIGDNCSVNPFSIVYGTGGTVIGNGVRIAAHTVIVPANHVPGDDSRPLYRSGTTAKGIAIDDYVWIGAGCRILDGVRIGRNAVIGAGSVVTQSIPGNCTAVGTPARVIRQR